MLVGLDERNKATQQLMKELTASPQPAASPFLLLRLLHKNLFIVRTKCCNLDIFGYVDLALFRINVVKCVYSVSEMLNKLV